MKILTCLDCNGVKKSKNGLYCKSCGYEHRHRPVGLKYITTNINPTIFKKGMVPWNKGTKGLQIAWNKNLKGIHLSLETEFQKGQEAWNKGKPALWIKDEKHPQWKGDKVGYNAIHSWIKRKYGKADLCERCSTATAKRYEWANTSGEYKRERSDWKKLCSKCHANEHKNWRYRWLTT